MINIRGYALGLYHYEELHPKSDDPIIHQFKREYRRAVKESMIDHEYTYERVDEDGCSSVTRYDFSKDFNTLEEMTEWATGRFNIDYHDRGYDCTGQWFTRWISVFELKDRFVIYVRNSRDV